jgi:hypothetical protein
MIKKSLITALLLLLAYHFVYPNLPRKYYRVNGQQRQNFDRAQEYVFGGDKEKNVIIGSSMSWELNADILGPDWKKLSFPGCSLLTALEIMRKSGKYPEVLLIETNQCFWDANEDILSDAFNPLMAAPRRHSRIFLEEARPSNFVAGIAEAFVLKSGKIRESLAARGGVQDAPAPAEGLTPELFDNIMKLNKQQMDVPLPMAPIERRIGQMGEHLDFLRSKGCICILFEMPIDPALGNLKAPVTVRGAMQARFPKDKYPWLTFDRSGIYKTSDGIHLRGEDAKQLTGVFLSQVGEIVGRQADAKGQGESAPDVSVRDR